MRTRLSIVGNRLGIVIEQPILDRLGLDDDIELDISIEHSPDGDRLILDPIRPATHRRRVSAAAKRALGTHAALLEKLAQ